ncbi:SurA N-terminal domain-containing protein, partial [Streptococcus pyogenes]
NGETITKDDFVPLYETQYQQMMMQAQQGGQPVDEEGLKKQTAENLVSTKLLSQETDKRGIEATDDDVSTALDETAQASQMSRDDFLA